MTEEELRELNASLDAMLGMGQIWLDSKTTQSNLIQAEHLLDKKDELQTIRANASNLTTQRANNAQAALDDANARNTDIQTRAATWNINNNDLAKMAKNTPQLQTEEGKNIAEQYGLTLQSDLKYSFETTKNMEHNLLAKKAAAKYTDYINSYLGTQINNIQALTNYVDWDPTTMGVKDVAGIQSLNPDYGYIDEKDLLVWFQSDEGQASFDELFPEQDDPETLVNEGVSGDIAKRLFTTLDDNKFIPEYNLKKLQLMGLGADADGFVGPKLTKEDLAFNLYLNTHAGQKGVNYHNATITHRDKANGVTRASRAAELKAIDQMVLDKSITSNSLTEMQEAKENLFNVDEAYISNKQFDNAKANYELVVENISGIDGSNFYDISELKFGEGDISSDIDFSLVGRHKVIQATMLKVMKNVDTILSRTYSDIKFPNLNATDLQKSILSMNPEAFSYGFDAKGARNLVGLPYILGLLGEDSQSKIVYKSTVDGQYKVNLSKLDELVGSFDVQVWDEENEMAMKSLLVDNMIFFKELQEMQVFDWFGIKSGATDENLQQILNIVWHGKQNDWTDAQVDNAIKAIPGLEIKDNFYNNPLEKYMSPTAAGNWVPRDDLSNPNIWDQYIGPEIDDIYEGNQSLNNYNSSIDEMNDRNKLLNDANAYLEKELAEKALEAGYGYNPSTRPTTYGSAEQFEDYAQDIDAVPSGLTLVDQSGRPNLSSIETQDIADWIRSGDNTINEQEINESVDNILKLMEDDAKFSDMLSTLK